MISLVIVLPAVCGFLLAGSLVLVVAERVLVQAILGANSDRWRTVFAQQVRLCLQRLKETEAGDEPQGLRLTLLLSLGLSLVQGCLLPLLLPLSASVQVLIWMMLFQVKFVVDGLARSFLFSLLAQLQLKRVIIRHTASQMLMAAVFLASMLVPLPNSFGVRCLVLAVALMAMMCQNGLGPFRFSLTLRELTPRYRPSSQAKELFHWNQSLQLVVSLALALNLSNPYVYAYCHLNGAIVTDFLLKLMALLVVWCLSFPFLPPFRTDKYGALFVKVWGPLASGLAWGAIFIKWWRGTYG